MNNFTRLVQQFHSKFGIDSDQRKTPGLIDKRNLQDFRINFLLEELCEYAAACGYGLVVRDSEAKFERTPNAPVDLHQALDGLVDLEYVLHGTVLFHGFGEYRFDEVTNTRLSVFEAAFLRVHQANMAKQRAASVDESKRKAGWSFDIVKPAGWKPATFLDLLDQGE